MEQKREVSNYNGNFWLEEYSVDEDGVTWDHCHSQITEEHAKEIQMENLVSMVLETYPELSSKQQAMKISLGMVDLGLSMPSREGLVYSIDNGGSKKVVELLKSTQEGQDSASVEIIAPEYQGQNHPAMSRRR